MKKLYSLALAGLAGIAFTSAVFAENRGNAVTFTLGDGYQFFAAKRHIKNTNIPFIALGYNFTDRWGIEALLGNFHTQQKDGTKSNVSGTLFTIDGLYHFMPEKPVHPYLLAGVGVIGLNPNGTDANNEANINAGLGAEAFIDKSVAFRFEGRDLYTIVGGKNDVFLDAGIIFYLDCVNRCS